MIVLKLKETQSQRKVVKMPAKKDENTELELSYEDSVQNDMFDLIDRKHDKRRKK